MGAFPRLTSSQHLAPKLTFMTALLYLSSFCFFSQPNAVLARFVLKHLQTTPAPEQFPCWGFSGRQRAQPPTCKQQLLLQASSADSPVSRDGGGEPDSFAWREGRQLQQVRAWDGCCMRMALLSNLCTCSSFN